MLELPHATDCVLWLTMILAASDARRRRSALALHRRSAHPRGRRRPRRSSPQALQRKYDGIKDFSADFVHTYQGGVLRKQITERGRLLVKKPGKMRWDYTAPEQKLFVSDGVKIYSYIPQDKQVIVGPCRPTTRRRRRRCSWPARAT